ncbi:tRNA (adenosine(37)-N6)-threonylcarbamoyltransferase complex dimerization subunit type 1 TsaB [Sedimenticola thiotaurini]|uniref:tRNA threonylcarbamoyladenosine biosynthesis protein TsaB n=1 Tax=Sedimenticola thiotaurini TaxID=1543721 RepID=A0A0F7JWA8_9GAMM|nr:tRNA (adenosine(37)-N6)-threonylcarbamoyltransferase complex dimerization subunit type 1 TsaB [Sedimenticola thiotaurini]AKH19015.1 glycoprotease [Sedimenticola thiotaurini]
MKILAIETATEACSAALLIDEAVSLRYQVQPRMHSQLILPMMDELLAEAGLSLAQLDAIAFGRGPGAFTGVRIAAGVAQGAAFAADLPVVPVSTLAALAQRAFRELGWRRLLPAYDARMQEVYWGAYGVDEQGLVVSQVADEVSAPDRVTLPEGDGWQGVGAGWSSYRSLLEQRLAGAVEAVNGELLCSAQDVALLGAAGFAAGRAVAPEQALPVYLRDKVALRPGESRQK